MGLFGWLRRKQQPVMPQKPKRMTRKEASDDLVKYGEDMANANRPKEALDAFNRAIEMYPKNDYAWGDRALMLEKQGDVDEALASFSNALSINPDNPITWNNKGLAFLKLKKTIQAIECFDKAIENDGDYAKALYNKGRALTLSGKTNESQECFNKARKLDPLLFTKLKKMKWD